jgi:hypothetical protein
MKAPLPPDEAQRLEALRRYDILDTPPEQAFDDLTLLAAQICQTPIALVSLVDENRQWFKSRVGLDVAETSRDLAFCAHAILHSDEVLEVRDTRADPRFADNALVTSEPHIRFYAGAPLVAPDGHALGTLCVIDHAPRELNESQKQALQALSRHATALLELRRAHAAHRHSEEQLRVLRAPPAGRNAWSLETVLLSAFVMAGVALVGAGVIAFRSLLSFVAETEWMSRTHRVIEQAQRLRTHVIDLESGERGYVITGLDAFLEPYQSGRVGVEHDLPRLRKLTRDNPDQQRRLDSLETLIHQRIAVAERQIELRRQGKLAAVQSDIHAGEGKALMDRVRMVMAEFVVEERALLAVSDHNGKARADRAMAAIVALGALTITLLALAGGHMGREIARRKHVQKQIENLNAGLEQRAAELAAARDRAEASERIKSAILEGAGHAIIATTPEGVITTFNPAAERMLGYTAAEVVGLQTPALIHDPAEVVARAQQFSEELGRTIAPGFEVFVARARRHLPNEYEWTYVRKDGARVPVLLSVTALHDAAGRITGFLGLAIDITERKRSEQQLRAKNEELKTFAYTVSHDLKAPLRGIAGYAQELERRHKEGLAERAQFCIAQIITASRNLDRLIEDLLKYSRLDAETPTVTEVDLPGLVQSILRDRSHTLTEQGVEVQMNVPPLTLRTWERGLHQVLTNLIDNAIKYSRESKPPRLTITAEALPTGCRVRVTDNGIGFDMKYHDRIFGLFNRLVRADEFEGTGAGLAIVMELMEKLGGTIRAESAPGEGATFIVELPL